jgi:putative ABC transport system substrate-binding protein
MNNRYFRYLFFPGLILFCSLFIVTNYSFSAEHRVAVVVSKRIRPYIEVLDAMVKRLEQNRSVKTEIYFLSDFENNSDYIRDEVLEKGYTLCVAIGPEAGVLVWSMDGLYTGGKIYTAVLNPEEFSQDSPRECGISLRIPVSVQIREITRTFPELENIGLLFDSRYNKGFYEKALTAAGQKGKKIIPLSVDSKEMIPEVLQKNWNRIDCIWLIPDETVISVKIVQYIIKQGLYHNKGVMGYNPFFISSGAFFSFEFDYKTIGIQTVERVNTYLENGFCNDTPPVFHKKINFRMTKKLGISVAE